MYIIECFNENEKFIKIGKTYRTLYQRFRSNFLPYKYNSIKIFNFEDAKSCSKFETNLHNEFKEFKYNPLIKFGGDMECFSIEVLDQLKEHLI